MKLMLTLQDDHPTHVLSANDIFHHNVIGAKDKLTSDYLLSGLAGYPRKFIMV